MSKGPWKKKIAQGGEAMKRLQERRLAKMREEAAAKKVVAPALPSTDPPADTPKVETSLNNKQDANVIQGNPDAPVGNAPPVESATPEEKPVDMSVDGLLAGAKAGTGIQMTDKDLADLAALLELSAHSVCDDPNIPFLKKGLPPLNDALTKQWADFGSRVIAKRMEKPLSAEWALVITSGILFVPRINFAAFKPKPKEEAPQ